MGCPPPPSMKKTSVRAPSKTDSSLGQPPVTTTGSIPGTCSRHLASSLQPALNSWSPWPWLGRPATRTTLDVSAAVAAVAVMLAAVIRSVESAYASSFLIGDVLVGFAERSCDGTGGLRPPRWSLGWPDGAEPLPNQISSMPGRGTGPS